MEAAATAAPATATTAAVVVGGAAGVGREQVLASDRGMRLTFSRTTAGRTIRRYVQAAALYRPVMHHPSRPFTHRWINRRGAKTRSMDEMNPRE